MWQWWYRRSPRAGAPAPALRGHVLELPDLRGGGAAVGRWSAAELAAGAENPGAPGAGLWLDLIIRAWRRESTTAGQREQQCYQQHRQFVKLRSDGPLRDFLGADERCVDLKTSSIVDWPGTIPPHMRCGIVPASADDRPR